MLVALRIELPAHLSNAQQQQLEQKFESNNLGVNEVVIMAQEQSAYIKVDTKQTPRATLELLVLGV